VGPLKIKCPNCGKELAFDLKPCWNEFKKAGIAIDMLIDLTWEHDHYSDTKECPCGNEVQATLHVVAVPKEGENDQRG
jgi:hypothetical protein